MLNQGLSLLKERVLRHQAIRFAVVGGWGLIIDYALLIILTEVALLHYLISATIAFLVANLSNFILNKHWTFADRSQHYARQYTAFAATGLIGLGLNALILYAGVELLSVHYLIVKIAAVAAVFLWNYFISRQLIFTPHQAKCNNKTLE